MSVNFKRMVAKLLLAAMIISTFSGYQPIVASATENNLTPTNATHSPNPNAPTPDITHGDTAQSTATPNGTTAPTATPEGTTAPTATPEGTIAPTTTPEVTATPEGTTQPTQAPTATLTPVVSPFLNETSKLPDISNASGTNATNHVGSYVMQDFEDVAGGTMGLPTNGLSVIRDATIEQSKLYNNTIGGDSCLLLTTGANGQFDVSTNFGGTTYPAVGKIVSYDWYCENLDEYERFSFTFGGYGNKDDNSANIHFGITQKNGNLVFSYRHINGYSSGDSNRVDVSGTLTTPVELGWNSFNIDYSQKGKVTLYANNDKTNAIEITIASGEFGGFSKAQLVNYWDTAAKYAKNPIYFDNFKLTTPPQSPTNLVVDDILNTFSWTNYSAATNINDYEFTIDGGKTYQNCDSNPQPVGNREYAIGMVGVRVISHTSEKNPTLFNETAFTKSNDEFRMFETDMDILGFGAVKDEELVISDKYSRSGLTSFSISSQTGKSSNNAYQMEASMSFPALVNEKSISIWFYDTMTQDNSLLFTPFNSTASHQNNEKFGLGIHSSQDTTYYYRIFGGDKVGSGNAGVTRSEGWHKFTWDYTSGTTCDMYIDDVLVASPSSTGFNKITIMDYWSTVRQTAYFDDFTISDTNTTIDISPAPTNGIVDDENKTFEFTTVPNFNDLSLYEYSTDNGKTFQTVESNPIQLDNKGIPVGKFLVRLKATTGYAGAVLRSTEAFMDPDAFYKDALTILYNKGKSYYEKDYTDASWQVFEPVLEKAKTALSEEKDYQVALDELQKANEQLVLEMENVVLYSFDDGENSANPFEIINGTPNWGEFTNISAHGTQNLMLDTEKIGNTYVSKLTYSFSEILEDKVVDFYFKDTKNGGTTVKLIDSTTGNGVMIYGASNYKAKTIVNGKLGNEIDTGMRRNGDTYHLEFNFAVDDGVKCYMDSRNWLNTALISGFDTIEISYAHSTAGEALVIDEFKISEANPVTAINLDDASATIGYYDTYEMNINNWSIETEFDYPTTDKFKWISSDSSVAAVTTGGSIEYFSEGTAKITATASSGVSASMDITCVDFKAQSVDISISDYNDTPNFADSITIEPGYIKVVNGIITPSGVTERALEWSSSNEAVVTVDRGELSAISEGTATITVTTVDGAHQDTINVIVAKDSHNYGVELFVALDGNDYSGDGSIEKPFATLERARDEIRAMAQLPKTGAIVNIRGGKYTNLEGITLEEQDQGSSSAPIKYQAYNNEEVVFVGTLDKSTTDFTLVTDTQALAKLPTTAQGKVYELDLSEYLTSKKDIQYVGHSMGNVSWLSEDGYNTTLPYYSLTIDGTIQTLSRWPNEGQELNGIEEYPGYTALDILYHAGANPRHWKDDMRGKDVYVLPEDRDKYDTFEISSKAIAERINNWVDVPTDGTNILDLDIYMSGYWYNDFSDQTAQIRYITKQPDGNYALKSDVPSGYSAQASGHTKFYVYNIMQELDIPGEWYLDQSDYTLYYYPQTGVDMNNNTLVQLSVLEDAMFTFTDTKNITVDGIDVIGVLNNGVNIYGCDTVAFRDSTVQSTALKAGNIDNSKTNDVKNSGFENVNFFDVNGGVSIRGGDSINLISANNYVQNCHFKNFATVSQSYNPAVNLSGVGNRITSCMIEDGPHNAIMYSGNDQVIEFTEITDVVQAAKDQAAIYTGRNVLQRGTVIRMNYIHDIEAGSGGNPNSAIYLDDLQAGADIIDNVFENMGWGIFVNGGRDTHMIDNQFIGCGDGIIINDWGYIGCNNWNLHGYGTLTEPNNMVPTTVAWDDANSAYGKYEHLATIREDDPWHSKYNSIIGNTYTNGTKSLVRYMSRGVQSKNYIDVINDWYFIKDN